MRRFAQKIVVSLLLASPILLPALAQADDTIKHPGDHPDYGVEIEPHGLIGWWDNDIAGDAFGVGARFSIPVVKNGFVKTINNSVAITFGVDILWGSWCNLADCGVTTLDFPVALQWNFYVAQRWSVFGEGGAYIWHNFYGDCAGAGCPGQPQSTFFDPALFVGGRYHFNDKVSLTMRLGFPTASVGVSFFL